MIVLSVLSGPFRIYEKTRSPYGVRRVTFDRGIPTFHNLKKFKTPNCFRVSTREKHFLKKHFPKSWETVDFRCRTQ